MDAAHFSLDDTTFEAQFEHTTFPKEWFDHEAHLRLAWIHLQNMEKPKAIDKVCLQIERYANSIGAGNVFHKTLTVAAVEIIAHFKERSKPGNFKTFIKEFPRLKNNFKSLLYSHYLPETLEKAKARREYLSPDLIPF